jgi:murein DD-endopeptidase MepM/ murein hydrolase activator NlpD
MLSSFSFILLLLLLAPAEKATASRQIKDNSLEIGKRYQLSMPAINDITPPHLPAKQPLNNSSQALQWQEAKVKKGDSLAKILQRFGFSARTTHELSLASKQLKKLKVGDKLRLGSNADGELIELVYPLSVSKSLKISRLGQQYHSEIEEKQVDNREAFAHATIESNFWNAATEAGMADKQIMNLANIFGWDIDFAMDLRKGDHFTVIYEKRYIDGEYIGLGNILAAEFVNQGELFQAIRFTDGEYYTAEGRSLRKAFLRAPVNFKYISSNFKKRRFHPVQKRWKAHRGVDYAANTGTPVVAAGDGKVIKSGYDKYNGHHVFIQHGNGIETKYIHFSKRKVKKGQRVKQGQVIGLVGATGLAAGPHLHYEFLVNGVHRNPRTVKLPQSQSLDKKYREAFNKIASTLLDQLEGSKRALLAMR